MVFILEPNESKTKKNSVPKINNIPVVVNNKTIPCVEEFLKLWWNELINPKINVINSNKITIILVDLKRNNNGSISGVIKIHIATGNIEIIIDETQSLVK